MAFNVELYTFSKKVNSTAQPAGADATTFSCKIKEPCGILAPVIGLNLGLANSPHAYNYAYIPEFKRYYYIREWTFENALWWAAMEVDVLASWKNQLGAATCYILRSAQDHNGAVLDLTYPATGASTYEESQSLSSPWVTDMTDGVYVVGVAGQSTTYYMFTKNNLDDFFSYLFSDSYANDIVGAFATAYPELKAQCNPLQYITGIMWMPYYFTGTLVASVRVGWADVPSTAWRVDGSGLRYGQTDFILRRHPQAEERGEYLNNAPYSHYEIFYPPWGKIALDPDLVANSVTVSALWGIDLRTGQGTLTIGCGNGVSFSHIMSWTHTQVGVQYQVSQVINRGYGVGNLIAPAASAVSSLLSRNPAGAIATAASEIGNFAASKIPSATTIGSNGGMDSLRGLPALQYEWKTVVDEDLSHRGRPLCENRQINTLAGFIMVADADINLTATKEEQDSVRSYMEGGFFYE